MTGWLASIPSPPGKTIDIGPLSIRAYGLAIGAGVVVAVLIAQRRWRRAGGDPDDISSLAMWAVVAGLIGARAWHVMTDWHRFDGRRIEVLYVWKGGLGIPGGLLAGVLVGAWLARRRGLPVARVLDAAAPAIAVAQAIGRLGNWFNQELFGRPTDAWWGLRIDPAHRPDRYADQATFVPTFAVEALWNLALAGALVMIGRRFRLRDGQVFTLYVLGYGLGRVWVETLRIDPAAHVGGVRFNLIVAALAAAGAAVVFVVRRARPTDEG